MRCEKEFGDSIGDLTPTSHRFEVKDDRNSKRQRCRSGKSKKEKSKEMNNATDAAVQTLGSEISIKTPVSSSRIGDAATKVEYSMA